MPSGRGIGIVADKLTPPVDDESFVRRPRLFREMSEAQPVTLVSAMSGSGKSVAVRQWIDTVDRPVAWVNVDALDEEPTVFWSHVIAALRSVCPTIDDEPELLLYERGATDRLFLVALISQLEVCSPVVLVLDGLDQFLDQHALAGVTLLVDRAHDQVSLVITSQVDPDLPIGRWRSSGWVKEVREDALRMTDDEAIELAHRCLSDVDGPAVAQLNRTVDGWPIAMRLAMSSGWQFTEDDVRHEWPDSDRSVVAHLTAQLLASMDEGDRDVALGLSVLDSFDSATCLDLLGAESSRTVRELLRRGVLVQGFDGDSATIRYHPLVQRLLEADLGWRDPIRRTDLHRRAAGLAQARGDMRTAFRHLNAISETGRSRELLVDQAFEIVDRGQLDQLRVLAAQLPNVNEVNNVELALELGLVAAWGAGTVAAREWCDHAEHLIATHHAESVRRDELTLGAQRLRGAIATLDVDLVTANTAAETTPRVKLTASSPRFDVHTALVVARSLLATRHPSTRDWIDRIAVLDDGTIISNATVPTLFAWRAWIAGELDDALRLSEASIEWIEANQIGPHHWGFDSYITAAWCRLGGGDVEGARRLADESTAIAGAIPLAWNQLQSAYLTARVSLAEGLPGDAIRVVEEIRETVPFPSISPYADRLIHVAAEAAIASGRLDIAGAYAAELTPGALQNVLRARIEPLPDARLESLLADRAAWAAWNRIQAEAIVATRSHSTNPSGALVDLVQDCARTGWVMPLLDLGPRVDRTLAALPLDELHPRLGEALDRSVARRPDGGLAPSITPRELSLLELLPTHMSYSEIGERMYLSVNTVKSSLKGLYRKLDAHTRAEAVAAGRSHGLI